ncbi:MAG: VWA domain-containing protein [Planctomycetes bacterium]|nr:VWA domain-containing protein [Planctomycetota bacterium]
MSASLTFGEVTLLDPWFLLVAPLAVLAVGWRWWRPRAALHTASVSLFAGLRPTLRQRLVWLPQAGRLLAVLCLSVAMARPVQREVVPIEEEGVDIVLVVDTSSSMTIDDMSQTESIRRMDAARSRAEQFAAKRSHDRVGLITFAHYAELRCPPTLDERALAAFLHGVDTVPTNSEYDGTAIGTALAKAVQVLAKSKAKAKVAVLLTDGENTIVDILPADGAKLAKDSGIRVHTIGLGNGVPTPFGFQRLDFADLRMIAETTGGAFFQPKTDADLGAVYDKIDELEKTELEDPRYRTIDRFEWPLGAGLGLLLLALCAEVLLFRRIP